MERDRAASGANQFHSDSRLINREAGKAHIGALNCMHRIAVKGLRFKSLYEWAGYVT